MSLVNGIHQKLHELKAKVGSAVNNTERSGVRRPAHTLQGKIDQVQCWVANPTVNDPIGT